MKTKILFLSTNPLDTEDLRLQEEIRIIEKTIEKSGNVAKLEFISKGAVTKSDLVHYLNKFDPEILHISGHADELGNILFEGQDKFSIPLRITGLITFLDNYKSSLELVILNACNSASPSVDKEIESKLSIPFFIGMNTEIHNHVAQTFSESFYNSYSSGKSIEESFKIGRDSLRFENCEDAKIPTIIINQNNNQSFEENTLSNNRELPKIKVSNNDKLNFEYKTFKKEHFKVLEELIEIEDISAVIEKLDPTKSGRQYDKLDSGLNYQIKGIIEANRINVNNYDNNSINRQEYIENQREVKRKIAEFISSLLKAIEDIENKSKNEQGQANNLTLEQLAQLYGADFSEVIKVAMNFPDIPNKINISKNKNAVLASVGSFIFFGLLTFIIIGRDDIFNGVKTPLLIINCILQISIVVYMITNKIVPTIGFNKFERMRKSDDYLKRIFQNNVFDMYKYYLRATSAIKQFSIWWKWLGISFLMLYLFYFLIEIAKLNHRTVIVQVEHSFDIAFNTFEAFILYIIYKLLTDKTLQESYDIKGGAHFVNMVKWKKPLIILIFFLLTYVVLYQTIYFPNNNFFGDDIKIVKGLFHLFARLLSGLLVALSLCMVIGRLDSKFIAAKGYKLGLLYLYAALQVLFILFDKNIVENLLFYDEVVQLNTLEDKFKTVKLIVLYPILILKLVFILFVYDINKRNFLFYYFLLGSKLNDNITSGKIGNEFVQFEEKKNKSKLLNINT